MFVEQRERHNPTLLRELAEKAIEAFFAIPEEEIGEDECFINCNIADVVKASNVPSLERMERLLKESGYSPADISMPTGLSDEKTWEEFFDAISNAVIERWIIDNYPSVEKEEQKRSDML